MRKHQKNFDHIHSQLTLPFLATNPEFLPKIFRTLEFKLGLKKNSNQRFIDLGAGEGHLVIYASLNYRIRSFGIEIDPSLIEEAYFRIKDLKVSGNFKKKLFKKIKIKMGDFYQLNLKKYDFIYIYSLPTMQKYLNHLFKSAKRGSIIISHKYPLDQFNMYLEFANKIKHQIEDQELYTYFYLKL